MVKWEYRQIQGISCNYADGPFRKVGDHWVMKKSGEPLAQDRDWETEFKRGVLLLARDGDAGHYDYFWPIVERLGMDGWELVAVDEGAWVFKRPISGEARPRVETGP